MPQPKAVRLYHAPGAGTDAIDAALLPAHSALCNCFGHEGAIAEYVMTALLMRHVPLQAADADLRQQRWTYWAGRPTALRTELGAQTLVWRAGVDNLADRRVAGFPGWRRFGGAGGEQ